MRNSESFMRMRTLQVIVLLIFALIVGRLAYIQLFDSRYDDLARANVLRHVVQYPPRGEPFSKLARSSTATANIWCRAANATT